MKRYTHPLTKAIESNTDSKPRMMLTEELAGRFEILDFGAHAGHRQRFPEAVIMQVLGQMLLSGGFPSKRGLIVSEHQGPAKGDQRIRKTSGLKSRSCLLCGRRSTG